MYNPGYLFLAILFAGCTAISWDPDWSLYLIFKLPSNDIAVEYHRLIDDKPFDFEITHNCTNMGINLVFDRGTDALLSSYNITIYTNLSYIIMNGIYDCNITAINLNTTQSAILALQMEAWSLNCSYDICQEHSSCNPRTGQCKCDPDYFDYNCQTYCNANSTCGGHGICNSLGECHCYTGYYGNDCSCSRANCSNHGECIYFNQCHCDHGYWGLKCDQTCECQKGDCDTSGECVCYPNFFGTKCEHNCSTDCTLYGGQCNTNNNTCTCPALKFGVTCQTDLTWLVIVACIIFIGLVIYGTYFITNRCKQSAVPLVHAYQAMNSSSVIDETTLQ